jgi:MFS family permease
MFKPVLSLQSIVELFFHSLNLLKLQFTASINTLVSPLGGILSATILDQFGRKVTLIIINILSIISWGLIYFSSRTDFDSMLWSVMLGRFLIGKCEKHEQSD